MTAVTTSRDAETVECAFESSKSCFGKVPERAAKALGFVYEDARTGLHLYICHPCAHAERAKLRERRAGLYRDIERTLRESPN